MSTNPFESSQQPATEPEPTENPPRKRGRLVPPIVIWLVLAALLIVGVFVRVQNPVGDAAVVNIITLLVGLLAAIVVGVWFTFFSGYSRRSRVTTIAVLAGLFVLAVASFRLEGVSGELVPQFRPRWTKRADETLDRPVANAVEDKLDLTTETEFDFPQFLGPNRDGRVDNVELNRDWSANPPKLLWKQPIGAGWSAFVVRNGYAVTMEQRGEEEFVTCYAVETGKPMWAHGVKARHQTVPGGIGPRSTPVIHEGRVYSMGAEGELSCIDGATGDLIWRDNLLSRYFGGDGQAKPTAELAAKELAVLAWGRAGSPLIVDHLVVVPAGGADESQRYSLAAFDQLTGSLVWEAGKDRISYSSPVLATLDGVRQILIVNEKTVSGHDATSGKPLWSIDWPGNSAQDANVSQPLILPDNRVMLSKGYNQGAAVIEVRKEGDAFKVTEIWRDRTLLKTKYTNAVLYGSHTYALSDGILECVEWETGDRTWKKGRFGQGQVLGVRDLLLIQAEKGDVVMVRATPEQFEELGRFTALEGITWNNLCLTGKRLLVRNSEQAACYELP